MISKSKVISQLPLPTSNFSEINSGHRLLEKFRSFARILSWKALPVQTFDFLEFIMVTNTDTHADFKILKSDGECFLNRRWLPKKFPQF